MTTAGGTGKIPSVTLAMLGEKGYDPKYKWITGLPAKELTVLRMAANVVLRAGASIITIQPAAKGRWELGLRKREPGNSDRHPVQIPKSGKDFKPLISSLKSIACAADEIRLRAVQKNNPRSTKRYPKGRRRAQFVPAGAGT